jgi:TetR/AcrR family transcriptional regulator
MNYHQRQPSDSADAQKLSTREKILAAARDEFTRFGSAGARVDRIARAAHVNKAMIYYHFTSKDALYLEVVRTFFSNAVTELTRALDTEKPLDEILADVADVYSRLLKEGSSFRPILLHELARPREEVVEEIAEIVTGSGLPGVIAEKLSEGIRVGEFRAIDVRQTTLSFIILNIGYALIAPLPDRILSISDRHEFIEQRKRAVVDLFLYGAKARQA